ncbi:MAG: hypothetical protein H0T89_14530, partial [Deltaproteobacteria bacterium]|nr:hypothetical protein [Deltaproteobacteria bacterium]MDQ3301554.1 hypothetical protein [Myxococcota bacterium]
LYTGRPVEAGFAASRAVARSPGLASAQALLGSLLLEAGSLDDALAHLEAAYAIDPLTEAQWDLARAHAYAGDYASATVRIRESPNAPYYSATLLARFQMWQGQTFDDEPPAVPDGLPPVLERFSTAFMRIARTRQFDDTMRSIDHVEAPRLRCALAQMLAEAAMFANEPALALDLVGTSVASGLQDTLWMRRCPPLRPLHGVPRFAELASVVEERAEAVLASIRVGLEDAAR